MIDYLKQLNAFNERCLVTGLAPRVRCAYYTLLDMNNRLFWVSSFRTTIRIIADRSGLDKNAVDYALRVLKNEGFIEYVPSNKKGTGSLIKICPLYGTDTGTENKICPSIGTNTGTNTGTDAGTDAGTNSGTTIREDKTKENNKPKKTASDPVKKSYAENVRMTEANYQKLLEKFNGNDAAVRWCIEKLDNYKGAKGVKYKDDYRAILSWVVKEYWNDARTNTVIAQYPSQGDDDFGLI